MKHLFEYGLALATSLDRLMNVEVKDAKRCNLADLTILLSNEELARSDLQKAYHCVRNFIDFQIKALLKSEKSLGSCDSLRQLLGLRRCGSHIVNNFSELVSFSKWISCCASRSLTLAKVHA